MRSVLTLVALLAAPLARGGSAALRPLAGGRGAAPEVVQIKTSDSQILQASFYKPSEGRFPGVILVHDAGASRAQLETLADRIHKQGFGVLAVDLRGHGGSKSARVDWATLSESERKATWSFASRDLDAAAEWLLTQPSIHGTSLSLVGYGAGCALAVRHAKNDENVVCMTLLAPNAEDYGFDVRADFQTLEGLPTYVVTAKDDEAERMAQEANASSSSPFVELLISPPKVATPLDDKAMPGRVAKWLGDKALLKKGRG